MKYDKKYIGKIIKNNEHILVIVGFDFFSKKYLAKDINIITKSNLFNCFTVLSDDMIKDFSSEDDIINDIRLKINEIDIDVEEFSKSGYKNSNYYFQKMIVMMENINVIEKMMNYHNLNDKMHKVYHKELSKIKKGLRRFKLKNKENINEEYMTKLDSFYKKYGNSYCHNLTSILSDVDNKKNRYIKTIECLEKYKSIKDTINVE